MNGNGTVIGGLTDEKTDILHFEHGARAVGEGFVEVVGAGEGVDGDGRGGGHFFFSFFFGGRSGGGKKVVVGVCWWVCWIVCEGVFQKVDRKRSSIWSWFLFKEK